MKLVLLILASAVSFNAMAQSGCDPSVWSNKVLVRDKPVYVSAEVEFSILYKSPNRLNENDENSLSESICNELTNVSGYTATCGLQIKMPFGSRFGIPLGDYEYKVQGQLPDTRDLNFNIKEDIRNRLNDHLLGMSHSSHVVRIRQDISHYEYRAGETKGCR